MKILHAKTREEIAMEYGVCRKTLYNWLKKEGIRLDSRLVSPKDQEQIYQVLGYPFRIGRPLPKS